jgi:hypothetical protein
LEKIGEIHQNDLKSGCGETTLPGALQKKYPNANKEWEWQWVLPSKSLSIDPESGKIKRYHIQPITLQRAVKKAIRKDIKGTARSAFFCFYYFNHLCFLISPSAAVIPPAAPSCTAVSTVSAWTGFIDIKSSSHKLFTVHTLNRGTGFFVGRHFYETESPVFPGKLVLYTLGRFYTAKRFKRLLQTVTCCFA